MSVLRTIISAYVIRFFEAEMSFEPTPKSIVGPSGETMTLDDLPAADIRRWTMWRKAQVIAAIRGGLITKEQACERCGISAEELSSWATLFDQHGLHGLRTTSLQKYRGASDRSAKGSDDPEPHPGGNSPDGALDTLT